MVKVAMLSKWHVHARDYANGVQKNPNSEIVYVWDYDVERGKEWAAELGVKFEPNLDKLLAQTDFDAVVIDTPTTMHKEVMIKCANAKKHIYTEKTLTETTKTAEEVVEVVEKSGIKFAMSYPELTDPVFQFAKAEIEKGTFGKVSFARLRKAHNGLSAKWLPEYWFDVKDSGGGALMDLGCHPVYKASNLFGKPKKVSTSMASPFGSTSDETTISVIEFENGTIASCETSFITAGTNLLEIHGSDAVLIAMEGGNVMFSSKETAKCASGFVKPILPSALPTPLDQFIEACDKGTKVPDMFGVREGLKLTKILENSYISNKTKTFVDIK